MSYVAYVYGEVIEFVFVYIIKNKVIYSRLLGCVHKKNIVELYAIETAIIRLSATLTEVVFITTINGKLLKRKEKIQNFNKIPSDWLKRNEKEASTST